MASQLVTTMPDLLGSYIYSLIIQCCIFISENAFAESKYLFGLLHHIFLELLISTPPLSPSCCYVVVTIILFCAAISVSPYI